jgi:hypothetical protein
MRPEPDDEVDTSEVIAADEQTPIVRNVRLYIGDRISLPPLYHFRENSMIRVAYSQSSGRMALIFVAVHAY